MTVLTFTEHEIQPRTRSRLKSGCLNMSREETVIHLLEIQISILILDPADRIKINDMIFKHKNNGN